MDYTQCKWCGSTIFVGVAHCSSCGKDAAGKIASDDTKSNTAASEAMSASMPTTVPVRDQSSFGIKFFIYAIPVVAAILVIWKIYTNIGAPTPEENSKSPEYMMKMLSDPDSGRRYHACLNLQSGAAPRTPPAGTFPLVMALLKDPNSEVRASCGLAIRSYGAAAREAIPSLILALQDPSSYIRLNAAESLGKIASQIPEDRLTVPALIDAMQDKDEQVRGSVLRGLETVGERAAPAIPVLLKTLRDHSTKENLRDWILSILGRLAAKSDEIVPLLIQFLRDPDLRLRVTAIRALGNACPLARPAIPDLVQMSQDQDEHVRREASEAIDTCCTETGAPLTLSIQLLCQRHVSVPYPQSANPASIPR